MTGLSALVVHGERVGPGSEQAIPGLENAGIRPMMRGSLLGGTPKQLQIVPTPELNARKCCAGASALLQLGRRACRRDGQYWTAQLGRVVASAADC